MAHPFPLFQHSNFEGLPLRFSDRYDTFYSARCTRFPLVMDDMDLERRVAAASSFRPHVVNARKQYPL